MKEPLNLGEDSGVAGATTVPTSWNKISSWFSPPSTLSEEQSHKALLLLKVVIAMGVTTCIAFTSALFEPQNELLTTIIFYGVCLTAEAVLVYFLRRGRILVTGWLIIFFLWAIVAFTTLFFGGLHSQIPVMFVVVITFTASFLGGRAAIILSIISSVFLGIVAVLESTNRMPPLLGPAYSPLNAWTGICIAFLLMAVLLHNSLTTIRENEERYQLAVRGSAAGLWDWDVVTRGIYYSASFKIMLGYHPSEFPYTFSSFDSAIHPDDQVRTRDAIQAHFESAEKPYDVEIRLMTKQKTYRWFQIRGEALRNKQGKPYRMVGSIVDITKRKLAEEAIAFKNEELQKINTELDQFVYSASHDLRAPIASLLGLVDVARLEVQSPELKSLLNMQERSLLKMDKLIKDIVSYSRNSRTTVDLAEIDFRILLMEIYDQLHYLENTHTIRKITKIDDDLVFHGDKKRIGVVLASLLSNAITYSDCSKADALVETLIRKVNTGIKIHVIDNGTGIDAKHLPRIFDMFYRASEKSLGSGIGLYIAKEIVDKLQGTIEVVSEKGKGSEVVVWLPEVKV